MSKYNTPCTSQDQIKEVFFDIKGKLTPYSTGYSMVIVDYNHNMSDSEDIANLAIQAMCHSCRRKFKTKQKAYTAFNGLLKKYLSHEYDKPPTPKNVTATPN